MWTPGTLVATAWKGPPVLVPGLGSHVSSWLAPPWKSTTSARRWRRRHRQLRPVVGLLVLLRVEAGGRVAAPRRQRALHHRPVGEEQRLVHRRLERLRPGRLPLERLHQRQDRP